MAEEEEMDAMMADSHALDVEEGERRKWGGGGSIPPVISSSIETTAVVMTE
jgi:hypothetical protein